MFVGFLVSFPSFPLKCGLYLHSGGREKERKVARLKEAM
jgi:hypothetical protein